MHVQAFFPCYTALARTIRVTSTHGAWSVRHVQPPALNLQAFRFRNDPDSRLLWQKYQLSITPKFYAVLTLLLSIAAIRNLLGTAAAGPSVWMTALVGLTTLAGFYRTEWFPVFTRMTSLAFMPLILWAYATWPGSYPPPSLILLPLSVLFVVFADHLATASAFMLFALGLLTHAALRVPPLDHGQYELLLAFAITTGMLYVSAMLLWFLLHGLYTSRAQLSEALAASLTLRQSLLTVYFDKLSPPLIRLEQQLKRETVSWPDADRFATEVRDILTQARNVTLSLSSRFDLDHGHSELELEHLRNRLWKFLLIASLVSCLLIMVAGLAGVIELRPPELGAVLVVCVLLRNDMQQPLTARTRLAAIYVFASFIGLACVLNILEQRPVYPVLYFYIPVFCAVFISGPLHAAITALAAAVFLGIWYLTYPPLEGPPAYMRSNIVLALIFLLAFSHIVWTWFRQSLREISEGDNQLRRETETRHRLMATLFHDIANPLQVIHGNVDLALNNADFTPNLTLLRNLATKIRELVAFTREFEEIETSGGLLPVERVELTALFADLQATYGDMLAGKDLVLSMDMDAPPVLAHGAILGTSVLSNLLTNAIKFSPRGSRIHIGTEALPGGRLRIRFQDGGRGMSAGVLLKLQSDELVRSTPGTAGEQGDGQGLRLATLYLNRMNGALLVDSGSFIAVELPLAN